MDTLVASLKLGGSFALTALGNLILIPVVLFYLLYEWDRWVLQIVQWVPLKWRPAYDSFMSECDAVLGQYFRGQLLVMLALSVLCGWFVGVWSRLGHTDWCVYRLGSLRTLSRFWLRFDAGAFGRHFAICLNEGCCHGGACFGVGQLLEGFG